MVNENLLRKYQGKMRFSLSGDCPKNFLNLARDGIYVAFADAIEYKNHSFLFVGFPDAGKTILSNLFLKSNSRTSKRLSEDVTINQIVDDQMYSFTNSSGVYIDFEPIICEDEKFPVTSIFYLTQNTGSIKETNLEDALSTMFFNGTKDFASLNRNVINYSLEAYSNIPVIKIPSDKNSNVRYHKLKGVIDELVFQ